MGLESSAYRFYPITGYWFTSFLLEFLRSGRGCLEVTLDMGITRSTVRVDGDLVRLNSLTLSVEAVAPSEVDRVVVYDVSQESAYEVVTRTARSFYKLKAIAMDKAPTLEINGIHMHRIAGIDPWSDTLLKVRAARVRRGNLVLDTCTGLGYTAIASLLRGAREVYTFEVDDNVMWIAQRNPWSRGLSNPHVKIHLGDVSKCIYNLPDSYFHRVIHDPPRFTKSTGNLYSLEFYKQLNRVLKPSGLLFHYTGDPRRHGAPSILKGIKERLEKAGFRVMYYDEGAQGYVAVKLA